MLNIYRLPQWVREVIAILSILDVPIIRPKPEVHGPIVYLRHVGEEKKSE